MMTSQMQIEKSRHKEVKIIGENVIFYQEKRTYVIKMERPKLKAKVYNYIAGSWHLYLTSHIFTLHIKLGINQCPGVITMPNCKLHEAQDESNLIKLGRN